VVTCFYLYTKSKNGKIEEAGRRETALLEEVMG
jgi:hypothetical protein